MTEVSAGISKLAQLRTMSVVVADTGDYDAVKRLRPVDCTTNPSIVRKALDLPIYAGLIEQHVGDCRARVARHGADVVARDIVDVLTVGVGAKLSSLIPGRVSTEVDADLSHDTAATVAKAHRFIAMYRDLGIGRERVLIKVAATWEGIRAAEELQREGIDCNVTLIFNHTQAMACAEAGAFLVSPFVGRILDWHLARGEKPATIDEDPGVRFVRRVYHSFKARGASTVVMGASFRSTAQIEALAGCDRLTIAPDLLEKLDAEHGHLPRKLVAGAPVPALIPRVDAHAFARELEADAMASEKLRDGIAAFTKDLLALRASIAARFAGALTRGAQWPLSLAALLLGLAPMAPAQELVSSLLTRAAVAPPGASITIDLLTVNPGTADAPLATAELLSGRVLAGEREWPVQLQSRPNASTHVSAGGFAARTFTLVLPPDATGRLILEVQPPAAKGAPVPPPLRAVLDVQAGAAAPPAGNAQAQSVLTTLTPPAAELQRSFFGRFSAHEPVYFIYGPDAPAAKFQFSFKYRVLNFGHSDSGTQRPTLNFGYTQRSLWELGSSSSPFYDTSYIPSLFVEWLAPRQDAGAGLALLGLQGGLQHESNGQPAPDSRSLNTVFARASVVIGPTDGFHVVASPRLFGYVASLSDNRELARYRGHGDVQLQFGRSDGVQLGYTGRIGTGFHNPSTQLDLTIPVHTRWLDFASYFLIQYFDGYGENLRDYDQHIQTIRAGVSLLR